MKLRLAAILIVLIFFTDVLRASEELVWPPAPDQARVRYLNELSFDKLEKKAGFFGKIIGLISGDDSNEKIALPFDLVVLNDHLYVICQNLPAILKIQEDKNSFELIMSKDYQLEYPVSICTDGERLYFTDSKTAIVYVCENDKIKPFITSGLNRPTGIAVDKKTNKLYIVDTGDHNLKIYDLDGQYLKTVSREDAGGLHYPTFSAIDYNGSLLVNDALNYKIRTFDSNGNLHFSFGMEGDGPGSFSRPKGIAVDSDSHLYVVDNMLDNVQVFDTTGRLLLVIGEQGIESGEFWSPAGIEIVNDTIYIADTFNNRIQILEYVGGEQ